MTSAASRMFVSGFPSQVWKRISAFNTSLPASNVALLRHHHNSSSSPSCLRPTFSKNHLQVLPEVSNALSSNRPVVALESTIIAHGMPYPQNLELSQELSAILREEVSLRDWKYMHAWGKQALRSSRYICIDMFGSHYATDTQVM